MWHKPHPPVLQVTWRWPLSRRIHDNLLETGRVHRLIYTHTILLKEYYNYWHTFFGLLGGGAGAGLLATSVPALCNSIPSVSNSTPDSNDEVRDFYKGACQVMWQEVPLPLTVCIVGTPTLAILPVEADRWRGVAILLPLRPSSSSSLRQPSSSVLRLWIINNITLN